MNVNDFLMTSGSPAAKFDRIGDSVTGPILSMEVQQQRNLDTNEPMFWQDGSPRQQLQIVLATSQRDPANAQDDGNRAIYVKFNLQKAVKEAVLRAGASGLDIGGVLTVTYTADGEQTRRGFNPPKLYSVVYQPPAQQAANQFLGNAPAAPQAYNQAPPAPAQPVPGAPTAQQHFAQQHAAAAPVQQAPAPLAHGYDQSTQFAQQAAAYQPPAPAPVAPAPVPQPVPAAWTPPPGMDPAQAAALGQLTPEQRAQLGYA